MRREPTPAQPTLNYQEVDTVVEPTAVQSNEQSKCDLFLSHRPFPKVMPPKQPQKQCYLWVICI